MLDNSAVVIRERGKNGEREEDATLSARVSFFLFLFFSFFSSSYFTSLFCFSFQLLLLHSFQLQDTVLEREEEGKEELKPDAGSLSSLPSVHPGSLSTKVNR